MATIEEIKRLHHDKHIDGNRTCHSFGIARSHQRRMPQCIFVKSEGPRKHGGRHQQHATEQRAGEKRLFQISRRLIHEAGFLGFKGQRRSKQYAGGINLYAYVGGRAASGPDPAGLAGSSPILGPWKWKKLADGNWEGTRGVTQFLGTVVTNGTNPANYHLLTYIMDIMKLTPVGASIIETVNHILDTQDFSEVRWRFGITAAWKEHEIVCKKGAQWSVSKKWVSGRHSFVVPYYGPNNGEVFPGSHESSQDVLRSAYDVAKEISKFVNGGE